MSRRASRRSRPARTITSASRSCRRSSWRACAAGSNGSGSCETEPSGDSLTGLLLRGPVVDALQSKVADAQRRRSVLSVAILDLDGFKSVNDTFGHLAGDRVLVTLGRLLATRFRAEDVRGRWGGEEFLVAFPGEPCEVAEGLVLRVLRELRETRFAGDQGEAFHITFSAGVASYPEDGLTVESLLKTADRRLYHAKRAGRTAWCARTARSRRPRP